MFYLVSLLKRVPPPAFWYAVFMGFFGGTQYAKGWYAVRRNSVISYADINFCFKKVQFSSRNTSHVTNYIVSQITPKNFARSLRSRLFKGCVSWARSRYDTYHDICLAITILIAIRSKL